MSRQWRICPICGERKKLQRNQITCSMKCRKEKEDRVGALSRVGICCGCGESKPLRYEVLGEKTCSIRCRGVAYARFYRTGHHHSRAKTIGGSEVDCAYCKKKFKSIRYDQKFCSISCSGKWNYAFGNKGNRARELKALRRDALYAEIGSCRLCGVKAEDIIILIDLGGSNKATARGKFHRDHIQCHSKGGSDGDENLRWLCWFCNLTRRDMDSKHDAAIAAAGKAFWSTVKAS